MSAAAGSRCATGVEASDDLAAAPGTLVVGTITQDQVRAIAEKKLADLNANDLDQASKIIAGTARSMGVEVV